MVLVWWPLHRTPVLDLLRSLCLVVVGEGDDLIGEKALLNETVDRLSLLKVLVVYA